MFTGQQIYAKVSLWKNDQTLLDTRQRIVETGRGANRVSATPGPDIGNWLVIGFELDLFRFSSYYSNRLRFLYWTLLNNFLQPSLKVVYYKGEVADNFVLDSICHNKNTVCVKNGGLKNL